MTVLRSYGSIFGTVLVSTLIGASMLTSFDTGCSAAVAGVAGESQTESLREGSFSLDKQDESIDDLYVHFTREDVERGREYRSTKYIVFFLRTTLTLVFLYLLIRIQAVDRLAGIFPPWITGHRWFAAGVYAVILTTAISLLTLPINLYSGYFHEHAFGLSTRTLPSWFIDVGKYLIMQILLAFITFAGLYLLMGLFPVKWWIVSALLFSLFTVGLTALSPLVIDPLFNTFTPLEDADLQRDIIKMSKRAGVAVEKVYRMDASRRTRKLNAYFTGLGATKRVVLYDTLLSKGDHAEVLMVVAHELGHWKRNHLWKGLLLASLGTFVMLFIIAKILTGSLARGWGISTFDDPVGVPVVIFIVLVLGTLSLPVQNFISRHYEKQADMDSLVFTGDPDTFIRVEEKMGKLNLNDVDPNPWLKWILFSHPPTIERIRMGEEFKKSMTANNTG